MKENLVELAELSDKVPADVKAIVAEKLLQSRPDLSIRSPVRSKARTAKLSLLPARLLPIANCSV